MIEDGFSQDIKKAGQLALDLCERDNSHGEMSDPEVISKWMDDMIKMQEDMYDIIGPWSFYKYEKAIQYLPTMFTLEETKTIFIEWENSRHSISDQIKRKVKNWFKK